jgi:hypothetical protein
VHFLQRVGPGSWDVVQDEASGDWLDNDAEAALHYGPPHRRRIRRDRISRVAGRVLGLFIG